MGEDIIVALATPPLKSALALIRLSGDGVFELIDKVFSRKTSGTTNRKIFYGKLLSKDKTIDQVEVFAYPKPRTFTGEDIVEISCHGSMVIVNQIIETLLSLGARYATNGEFSSRAFYNGKIDLIEAEAINDLINATTDEAKQLSLFSLEGKTSGLIAPLKIRMADLLSLIEVNIDFPEYEDIEEASREKIINDIGEMQKQIARLLEDGEKGLVLKEGINVAIVGAPNAGKSSLLNALLKKDKAIVSEIPGTTRDVVEGDFVLDGVPLHLLDTAGIRKGKDAIENLGIHKSKESIADSDLVIYVIDAANPLYLDEDIVSIMESKPIIKAYNKCDICCGPDAVDGVRISALNGKINTLKDAIKEKIGISSKTSVCPSLCTARQIGLLKQIASDLKDAKRDAIDGASIDLVAVNLHSAYNKIGVLLGEGVTLDMTEEIFSRFCVGK